MRAGKYWKNTEDNDLMFLSKDPGRQKIRIPHAQESIGKDMST